MIALGQAAYFVLMVTLFVTIISNIMAIAAAFNMRKAYREGFIDGSHGMLKIFEDLYNKRSKEKRIREIIIPLNEVQYLICNLIRRR